MAEIRPFRGLRYNAAAQGRDLGDYLSPPFDTITPEEQAELLRRSPHNIVRLELVSGNARDGTRYEQVARIKRSWMEQDVFMTDAEPSMYVAEEEFVYNQVKQLRRGFIVAVRLEEFDRGIIFPHENVRDEWVRDRVQMMEATRHAISPLLVVYQDDIRHSVGGVIRAVAGGPPSEVATMAGGHTLRLWKLTDPGTHQVLIELMRGIPLFIADGHHRYEAAMRFRSAARVNGEIEPDSAINYRMMHLVSIDEPGLITRPFHRVLRGTTDAQRREMLRTVESMFDVTEWDSDGSVSEFADAIAALECDGAAFGMCGFTDGRYLVAQIDRRGLEDHIISFRQDASEDPGTANPGQVSALDLSDYTVLHRYVLEPALRPPVSPGTSADDADAKAREMVEMRTEYQHDPARVDASLASSEADGAFVMRSVPMQEFVEIVSRGDRLPPKATNFYPKPPAGSVLQPLDGTVGSFEIRPYRNRA